MSGQQIATPNLLRDFKAFCIRRNIEAPTEELRVLYAHSLALIGGAVGFLVPAKEPYRLVMDVTRDCEVDLRPMHLPFPKVALEQTGKFEHQLYSAASGQRRVESDGVITFCEEQENGFLSYRALRVRESEGHRWIPPAELNFAPRDYVLFSADTIMARYETRIHESVSLNLDNFCSDARMAMAVNQIGLIAQFISLCSCENVRPTKISEPTQRMQTAAKRRGNLPHDDYWTLDIFLPSKDEGEGIGIGGQHASPRLHFRRGHIRRLQTGRNTWVRHCMVGRAELGRVEKDYRVITGRA